MSRLLCTSPSTTCDLVYLRYGTAVLWFRFDNPVAHGGSARMQLFAAQTGEWKRSGEGEAGKNHAGDDEEF